MVRAIDADKAIEVAQIKYNDWNLAMAAADGQREINLCFKKQELFKAVKSVLECVPTITQPNEPLTQADLDSMDYDKVWIDYGDDGEWALVVSGRIYALAVLEGAGFGDILRDEVDGETMNRPSGNYTVYRCPPEAKDNNVPTNEPLTIEELREMDGEPVWVEEVKHWALIDIEKGGQWDGIPFAVWAENGTKFTYNIKNRGLHCYRRPPEGEGNA